MAKIAPSLLSADFSKLGEEVRRITSAGADFIHFDVMDGHFVPNITVGPLVLKAIRKFSNVPFQAHLMISRPQDYWKAFAEAGANIIGIHIECEIDHAGLISQMHQAGKSVCLVINPPTAVEKMYPFLEKVEEVMVMTVNPGFGGQGFIREAVPKIENLANLRNQKGYKFQIEVDGGINLETAGLVKKAGADILVAGSFIFGKQDYRGLIEALRWC